MIVSKEYYPILWAGGLLGCAKAFLDRLLRMSTQAPFSTGSFVSQVVLAYGSGLHRFLVKRLRRREDAADVAQEVYVRLLRLPRTDLIRKPHAYVYFVASQVAAEYRMREKNEPLAFDSEALERLTDTAAYAKPEEMAESIDTDAELRRLLGKLATNHRNVLILKKRDGLSTKEIAKELGLSEHTVKKYLFQAMGQIAILRKGRKLIRT